MGPRQRILGLLKSRLLFLDGAFGTEIERKSPGYTGAPELLNLEKPELVESIHRSYIDAGSHLIETNTFGATGLKLSGHGLADRMGELNRAGAAIALRAVRRSGRKDVFVAGSIGPTGRLLRPFGEHPFDEIFAAFREQASILADCGIEVFQIETMSDIQEARAAVIAVRETCPEALVIASMTYDARHRTLTGTDPLAATAILSPLGVDIIAVNCGTGPEDMLEVVTRLTESTDRPVAVLPNAGLPALESGRTVYRMSAETFADHMVKMADAGASVLGGCCGTTPEFIRLMVSRLSRRKPRGTHFDSDRACRTTVLAGRGSVLRIGPDYPVRLIGERINPTAQKAIAAELKAGKLTELKKEGLLQAQNGADALDVNCGVPGIDEATVLSEALMALQNSVDIPLVMDSSSAQAVEAALKSYAGRLLLNSANAKKGSFDVVLPLVKRYGAAVILLPLDETGIPETASGRIRVVERLVESCRRAGLSRSDLLVDGLVMTAGSSQRFVLETIETIRICRKEFGLNSVLGISNVSYGLPKRAILNSSFLSIAIAAGLDAAIMNPLSEEMVRSLDAASVLANRDRNAARYISRYAAQDRAAAGTTGEAVALDQKIAEAVVRGHKDAIVELVNAGIASGLKPENIIREILIPAISRVGDLYENGTYFLPQLIMSAETMQEAVRLLQPLLLRSGGTGTKTKIVLATVKGDVHDIGKRIVCLMLENNGFEVVDLGKDVANETVLDRCVREGAALIGLSALMTTTMPEMKKMSDLMKKRKIAVPLLVGGAAVSEEYASSIGAYYARDAAAAVRLAKKLIQKDVPA